MALITSAASGNFSAGATWTGGVVPGVGDEARASNGHTITIDVDTACDEVSNAGTGIFTLASGVTLTANVTNKSTTTSRNCLQFTAVSPAVGSVVGNCTGGTVTSAIAANNTSTGTLTITGNVTSGSGSSSNGATNSSTGTITITGNVTAGIGANGVHNGSTGTITVTGNVSASSTANVHGANNNLTGTLNIIGNATGGSGSGGHGANNPSTGTLNITGNATGGSVSGSSGANNAAGGVIAITGNATGGVSGPGVSNASTGSVRVTRAVGNAYGPGNTAGLGAAVGAANVGVGVIEIERIEYGTYGMSATSGTGIRLKKVSSNVAVFNYVDAGSAKTLIDATQNAAMPAATDVRFGVSYASGALTGSAYIPAAGSVALGVPVDNSTGTAVLTPAAVWEYATRAITGGVVDTLTNSPDVPTEAEIASQVRTELSVELGRIDAAISSRLAPSGTLATVTTLTNAPTVPTAAAIADEVRVELATELARIDAPISGAGNAPSASTVATAVRTELATELARVDAAISTRLADADYVAPVNSDVAAIKVKTDALNTERLANVATTAIVGNLIAQGNS